MDFKITAMKKSAWILLICFGLFSCSKDYFTGIIESDIRMIPLVDTLNMDDFIKTNGSKITGIYNNGNFIYHMNAENVEIYFYDVDSGKYFFKARNTDFISYWDRNYSSSKVTDIKLTPKDTTILGYLCDKIEYYETFTGSAHRVKHIAYFNQEHFLINPGWYQNMKIGGYDEIMRVTRALPLLDIAEYPWMRFEYAASKVVSDTTVDIATLIRKYEESYPQRRAY